MTNDVKEYINDVWKSTVKNNQYEPEFLQAVREVFDSLEPVLEQHPEYVKGNILERIVEPERTVLFKVPWVGDDGEIHVNRGMRVQFNGAIGPYKGGLRFHKSVYLGIIKFLGFEQVFKNSLTGLPIGGGKGGSDFDPIGKSDREIKNFCHSFMTELYRHIGPDVDVPAGDIGVSGKEIGLLYGQYKRIKGSFENGVITGKPLPMGGSLIRPEATGYGATYFALEMLKRDGKDFKDKIVAISGFGNVSWGTCKKVRDLGGKVVTLSGPDGYIYDPDGVITDEKIDYLLEMRASGRDKVEDYAKKFNVKFFPGEKPWGVKVDVVIPCATQNEIHGEDAIKIVRNGCKYVVEAANMPNTPKATEIFVSNKIVIGPAKAANAGGVATSALEMSQNSMRINWSAEEVDAKLHTIMKDIYSNCVESSEKYGFGYDLIAGANIAGFVKVANAMLFQGDY